MKHTQRLRVHSAGTTVGELGADARGKIYFQYDSEWLKTGFDLSPGTLAFNATAQLSPQIAEFQGLHGLFHDSLPDGWGLLLMDRAFRQRAGWQTHTITPLDRLAYMGSRAMGALEYEPETNTAAIAEAVDIAQLAASAELLLRGETPTVLQQLQVQGGSPGGARPKVTVALSEQQAECLSGFHALPHGYEHWMVKFRSKEDPLDMGRIELAYAQMAKLAGLEMPECKLLKVDSSTQTDEFFAVRRFDRDGNQKHHVLSLSGYIYANHRLPCIDYAAIIDATRNITRSVVEAERAFRLMLFNVMAHNKDDHAKNFAFIRQDSTWRLSPAFDLTFSSGISNQHTTDIAGSGNPNLADIQRVAESCGIKTWREILAEVQSATAQWATLADNIGVSKEESKTIHTALVTIQQRLNR